MVFPIPPQRWEVLMHIFRALQSFSIGFKCGLRLGRWRTFTDWSWYHFFDTLAVFWGLLPCWKMNHHPSLRSRGSGLHTGGLCPSMHSSSSILSSPGLPAPPTEKPHTAWCCNQHASIQKWFGHDNGWGLVSTEHDARPAKVFNLLFPSGQWILFPVVCESFKCISVNLVQAVICLLWRSIFSLTATSV